MGRALATGSSTNITKGLTSIRKKSTHDSNQLGIKESGPITTRKSIGKSIIKDKQLHAYAQRSLGAGTHF